jgi:hypothetical protein
VLDRRRTFCDGERSIAMRPFVLPSLTLVAACSLSSSGPRYESGLEGLDLTAVNPAVVLPGSLLVVTGRSFVDAPFGDSRLVLRGSFDDGTGDREVRAVVPLRFVDFERMEAIAGEDLVAQLGAREGELFGNATIEVDSKVDGETHVSRAIGVALAFRTELTPALTTVTTDRVIYVNDRIEVKGDGLLLGGAEGTTYARVEGCFASGPEPCTPVGPAEVVVTPASPFDRSAGSFPFVPGIAGIRAGAFSGTVQLENRHGRGALTRSGAVDASYSLIESEIKLATPNAVSLGQYLELRGGGFVGGDANQLTLVHLAGSYTPTGGAARSIDTILVPEFVDGHAVRYALNEDDDLGLTLELRGAGGVFAGTVAPLVSFAGDEVIGAPLAVRLKIAPVKQVVFLRFTSQYVTSLQAFGLRAVDGAIRDRVVAVVERDFATINLEVRTARPTDFALYSEVEIGGPDPNGLALLGYDNTPGKDVGNLRLYDQIGGVNALTQQDGYPGYGGIFVESLFIFSQHPGDFVDRSAGGDPLFDQTFDPFRPDRDGTPVRAADLGGGVDLRLTDSSGCPASDRAGQIGCAVWVLGSLIGTTVSHEIGHSVGLANPGGADPHLFGDKPGRLMEAGGARSFRERAELLGESPGMFCDQEYAYLRTILPTEQPADRNRRPDCL